MAKARYITADGLKVYCRYDKILPIAELVEHPKNPNKHPVEQLERLAEIYKKNGIRQPIKISNLSGFIVAGHGRKRAAELLGLTEFPVEYQDYADTAAETADLIGDNRISELSQIDEKALLDAMDDVAEIEMTGFSASELNEIATNLKDSADDTDIDDSQNVIVAEKPFTIVGDIWHLGNHRLICGDSTDPAVVDKILDGEKADLVLTDPPYNVNFAAFRERLAKVRKDTRTLKYPERNKIENDNLNAADFSEFLLKAFKNINEVLKPGRAFYIFYAQSQTLAFYQSAKTAGLTIRQNLIWAKNNFSIGQSDYQWKHEPTIYGWKDAEKGGHYFIKDRSQTTVFVEETPDFDKMKKEELLAYIKSRLVDDCEDIIFENKPIASHLHSTMKPVKLLARFIKNSSRLGELLFEPFAGSGSLLIAAENMGRISRNIEINPIFCDTIVRRFALTIGKTDEIKLIRNGQEVDPEEWQHILEEREE